jgi:Raf kinase inhibitor-like YbhB/YbcL family protein
VALDQNEERSGMNIRHTLVSIILLTLVSCTGSSPVPADTQEVPMTLTVTSTAFAQGKPIPSQYSCVGKGVSPPLAWRGAPSGTKSFALIMDDPDAPAGTYVHWVIYNMPGASQGLPESVPGDAKLADGSLQGSNSSRRTGYTGPCPPSGTHRYYFKVYALDASLSLASGASKEQLLGAIRGHILAEGELMGTFSR